MFGGISLTVSEVPTVLIEAYRLQSRIHNRGGESEIFFLLKNKRRLLPVWMNGRLEVVRWGNHRGLSRTLPTTAWTTVETLKSGGWGDNHIIEVTIPTTMGLDNGVWYRIRQGIRGVVVHDESGVPVVYVLVEQSSHYYQVMTRCPWEPVMIGEKI